jgi:hypothetical protein
MRFVCHPRSRIKDVSVLLLVLCTHVVAQRVPHIERVAQAVRVGHKPALDGTLADPLWQLTDPISDFRQREPESGKPSTEKTEIRILYTRDEVFFGLFCGDSTPKQIVASEMRRDVSQDLDDHFEILIDSRHDHRSAYVFQVNPRGTQRDGLITEERVGDTAAQNGVAPDFDPSWDGVWESNARITEKGWTATVGIPFSTLNFTRSSHIVWGINFKRFIRHKNEEDLWSSYEHDFGITKVSQAGELTGITDIGSGRLFIVKPYGLAGLDHFIHQGYGTTHTGGVDIKYGLRSNLIANLTVNTDFADSDVDQVQFNLTPYKLFFPEKRQFFLENSGVFDFYTGQQERLFFSRQIGIDPVSGEVVPINAGAKVTGGIGAYQVGLMDVDTRASGTNFGANYAVFRVKRGFGSSYVGFMGIDKRSGNPNDRVNESGGFDLRLVPLRDLALYGWAALARSQGTRSDDTDVGTNLTYTRPWMQLFAQHFRVGKNYNPELGYLANAGVRKSYVDVTLIQRLKQRLVRRIEWEGWFFNMPDLQHVLQNQEWNTTCRIIFNSGAYSENVIQDLDIQRIKSPFNIYRDKSIPVGLYRFSRHQVSYYSPPDRRFAVGVAERFGAYYGGSLNEIFLQSTYRPNARFSVSLIQTLDSFHLPQGHFDIDLGGVQTNYSFSRLLSLTALIQVDTANSQAMNANVRLRYNYRPDSDLYVIFNSGLTFASLAGTTTQEMQTRFAIKLTYSFTPKLRHP